MNSLPPIVETLRVQIVPSSEHPVLAWSTAGMMSQYISYNPRIAAKLSPDVLAFALVHEYAHLHLKHVGPFESPKSPAEIRKNELEADRFAALFWATNNPQVAHAAAAAFRSPVAQKAFGSEKRSLEIGYPSREERAAAILDVIAGGPHAKRSD
jgi:Zn-dependent protease with chaperone function